jgi:hypothetical protein
LFDRSDNNSIHNRDVALGGLAAKTEMDQQQPGVALKHDPTAGLNIEQVQADEARIAREAAEARAHGLPPGLAGFVPQDPLQRQQMVHQQELMELLIQQRAAANALGAQGNRAEFLQRIDVLMQRLRQHQLPPPGQPGQNPAAPAAPIQAVQGQAPQPRRLVAQAAAQPPIAR